jgi:two-component system, OmpR family, response regulator
MNLPSDQDHRHVLVVEDDPDIADLLMRILMQDGFSVDLADSMKSARARLVARSPGLALVDLGLPDGTGLTLIGETLAQTGCGIIVVSGSNDETDLVLGLGLGADDFVLKPFRPRALMARVHAVLRRKAAAGQHQESLAFDAFTLHLAARRLTDAQGIEIELTSAEFDLLAVMLRFPGSTLSRDRLCQELRGGNWQGNQRAVDGLVSRLRRKFIEHGGNEPLIRTIHGRGYMFVGQPPSTQAPDR